MGRVGGGDRGRSFGGRTSGSHRSGYHRSPSYMHIGMVPRTHVRSYSFGGGYRSLSPLFSGIVSVIFIVVVLIDIIAFYGGSHVTAHIVAREPLPSTAVTDIGYYLVLAIVVVVIFTLRDKARRDKEATAETERILNVGIEDL